MPGEKGWFEWPVRLAGEIGPVAEIAEASAMKLERNNVRGE
ncbi:MAG: hypothetical protein P8J78_04405 [Maricaulis sp.]|jgi:hypothetical protein|nr:hypothetical protein [Maricaulis sp.]MDG2043832.1 hypothetical protein [Maricaulis sp.]